ncbi:MAG: hypothetical protein JXB00_04210 [Bacteroidales bacterium]|nr:hypothetical protein [Bacteroidales bacterium]
MIIDIRKTVLRRNVRSFFTTIIFLVAIAMFLVSDLLSYEIMGVKKYNYAIALAAVYIGLVFYNAFRNYHYIYYNDEGEKIILRFFSLGYFTRKKSSIELRRKDFAGFMVEKEFFGLRENLVIFQKTANRAAKYPPVSLTALTKDEKSKMLGSLKSFTVMLDQV